jgi:hypothetical protein
MSCQSDVTGSNTEQCRYNGAHTQGLPEAAAAAAAEAMQAVAVNRIRVLCGSKQVHCQQRTEAGNSSLQHMPDDSVCIGHVAYRSSTDGVAVQCYHRGLLLAQLSHHLGMVMQL